MKSNINLDLELNDMVQKIALGQIGVHPSSYNRWFKASSSHVQKNKKTNEVFVYGLIVPQTHVAMYQSWFGDDSVICSKMFGEMLSEVDGEVRLRINSPGGDVWEASGMIQAIEERPDLKCTVDGIAASAASLLMASCKDVTMAKMSMVMIHSASSVDYGNAEQLRKTADILEKVDNQAAGVYASRMSVKEEEVIEMLKTETWFTAKEAIESGLADRVFSDEDQKELDEGAESVLRARNERLQSFLAATATI